MYKLPKMIYNFIPYCQQIEVNAHEDEDFEGLQMHKKKKIRGNTSKFIVSISFGFINLLIREADYHLQKLFQV